MNFHRSNPSSRFNRQAQLRSDPSQYTTQLNSIEETWRLIVFIYIQTYISDFLLSSMEIVVCHLKKADGTRIFWSFQQKISWSHGTSEKVVLLFRTECSKRKFVFHFFNKAIFDTCFRLSRPFFGKWNWFVQMVNAIPGRKLRVLNFVYHLRKPFTDRFAHVNRKLNLCQNTELVTSTEFVYTAQLHFGR